MGVHLYLQTPSPLHGVGRRCTVARGVVCRVVDQSEPIKSQKEKEADKFVRFFETRYLINYAACLLYWLIATTFLRPLCELGFGFLKLFQLEIL